MGFPLRGTVLKDLGAVRRKIAAGRRDGFKLASRSRLISRQIKPVRLIDRVRKVRRCLTDVRLKSFVAAARRRIWRRISRGRELIVAFD